MTTKEKSTKDHRGDDVTRRSNTKLKVKEIESINCELDGVVDEEDYEDVFVRKMLRFPSNQLIAYGGDDGIINLLIEEEKENNEEEETKDDVVENNESQNDNKKKRVRMARQYDNGGVRAIAVSDDGKRVAVGFEDGSTKLYAYEKYDATSSSGSIHHPFIRRESKKKKNKEENNEFFSQAFQDDEDDEASNDNGGNWADDDDGDDNDGKNTEESSWAGPTWTVPIRDLCFCPTNDNNDNYLLTIASEGGVCIVNVKNEKTTNNQRYLQDLAEKEHDACGVRSITFFAHKNKKNMAGMLVSLDLNGRICLWEIYSIENAIGNADTCCECKLLYRFTNFTTVVGINQKDIGELLDSPVYNRCLKPMIFRYNSNNKNVDDLSDLYLLTPGKVHVSVLNIQQLIDGDNEKELPINQDIPFDDIKERESNSHIEAIGLTSIVTSSSGDSTDSKIITCGKDGRILLWDIQGKQDDNIINFVCIGKLADTFTLNPFDKDTIPTSILLKEMTGSSKKVLYALGANGQLRKIKFSIISKTNNGKKKKKRKVYGEKQQERQVEEKTVDSSDKEFKSMDLETQDFKLETQDFRTHGEKEANQKYGNTVDEKDDTSITSRDELNTVDKDSSPIMDKDSTAIEDNDSKKFMDDESVVEREEDTEKNDEEKESDIVQEKPKFRKLKKKKLSAGAAEESNNDDDDEDDEDLFTNSQKEKDSNVSTTNKAVTYIDDEAEDDDNDNFMSDNVDNEENNDKSAKSTENTTIDTGIDNEINNNDVSLSQNIDDTQYDRDDFNDEDDMRIDDEGREGFGVSSSTMKKMVSILMPKSQPPFAISSTPLDLPRRFLCWNQTGSITLVNQPQDDNDRGDKATVDIQFTNSAFGKKRPISFTDNMNIIIGSLGEEGAIFASDIVEDDDDDIDDLNDYDYSNDYKGISKRIRLTILKNERRKKRTKKGRNDENNPKGSSIYFHRFETFASLRDKDWYITLPDSERAIGCSTGDGWAAVITSRQFLRFFTIGGNQGPILWLNGSPITITGRSRYLAVFTTMGSSNNDNASAAFSMIMNSESKDDDDYKQQTLLQRQSNLYYTIYDGITYEQLSQGPVSCLTPGSSLTWAGFNEDNSLVVMDTDGMLSMLCCGSLVSSSSTARAQRDEDDTQATTNRKNSNGTWIPMLDTIGLRKSMNDNFWPIHVKDGKLVCVPLKGGNKYPDAARRPVTSLLPLRIPIAKNSLQKTAIEEVSIRSHIALSQKIVENDYLTECGENDDIDNFEKEHRTMCAQVDKVTLKYFSALISKGKLERAFDLVSKLHIEKSYELAMVIADRHRNLVDMIEDAKEAKFYDDTSDTEEDDDQGSTDEEDESDNKYRNIKNSENRTTIEEPRQRHRQISPDSALKKKENGLKSNLKMKRTRLGFNNSNGKSTSRILTNYRPQSN